MQLFSLARMTALAFQEALLVKPSLADTTSPNSSQTTCNPRPPAGDTVRPLSSLPLVSWLLMHCSPEEPLLLHVG